MRFDVQRNGDVDVYWDFIDAFINTWNEELKKKTLRVWSLADPPAPGAKVTVTLHLPDNQVIALFGRLRDRDLKSFEIRLDLPFVIKNKLKRYAQRK